MPSKLSTVLVAALVVLAGCAGAGGSATPGGGATDPGSDATGASGGSSTADRSTVDFYVSDERNDIGDFEHLNVTVTRVGFQRRGGNWTEHEVDDATVDLTRLQGANATLIESFDVPNGTYTKVFVYVSEVNGTLTDGSDQRVKLPSGKIQLDEQFTVGNGETVDFVFDITVHEAGKSGKYVLQPVASESGTDVPIEERGPNGEDAADDDESEDGADLAATLSGDVTPNGTATVTVTRNGTAVENATVHVNDERVGTTDANGTATFDVPDAEELTVRVVAGDEAVEIERELRDDDADGGDATGAGNGTPGQSAAA
ncbi:MAG: DUF4382 domain-containing protein [Haloferacaceae archaeon]